MTTSVFVQGIRGRMGQAVQAVIEGSELFALVGEVSQADVVVDFSRPEGAMAALAQCVHHAVPLVTGTTGLHADWRQARDEAAIQLPILEAPNMSVGVNLAYLLLETAAASIGADADIDIIETHHVHKLDAPSGTALRMGEIISTALPAAGDGTTNKVNYHSIRAGDIPGEHRVKFTLAGEQIEIGHLALNRSIFARGALRAAEWLLGASPGVYSMRDVLSERCPIGK